MVHLIWAGLACIGIVYALFNGTIGDVNEAIFSSANEAIQLVIGLTSILVFWLGLMKIAEKANILAGLSRLFRPVVSKLFPDLPRNHPVMGYITSNFIANIFGLGNAATPLGLKAMKEMKQLEPSEQASRSMVTFLAINTAGVTLIPTTVLALRIQHGSVAPTETVAATMIVSILTTTFAIIIDRLFHYKRVRK
ncbi:nucleoside recognition domain-containing protein [Amphibacillus xylanus]|uniref:Spore maturation protein A n=1 Tax=Amphibacillus xylanus (strain ATCC 51415 / DSM 6626 / JCM 7361 / LMG 17667 / NBRC 15112 / Ep01) TaxID=698758 RepID=K0IXX1_AMPXN|nr:nucleoside recognition domain-containing protein [Amphibacillus xylanus]BAM47345.1 spore maturation protein A [Amphibacillus xylanus NBRC 15112]